LVRAANTPESCLTDLPPFPRSQQLPEQKTKTVCGSSLEVNATQKTGFWTACFLFQQDVCELAANGS
jgi:hypothetical protein